MKDNLLCHGITTHLYTVHLILGYSTDTTTDIYAKYMYYILVVAN